MNNELTYYKISTPEADFYQEKYFIVDKNNEVIVESYDLNSISFLGWNWKEVYFNFCSVWKSWSSKCKDNVYPRIENLKTSERF